MIVAWVYGTDRVVGNLYEMRVRLGGASKWYWTICWRFVCPAVLAVLVGWTLYGLFTETPEALTHATPRMLSWLMHLFLLAIIPVFACKFVVGTKLP